MLNWYNARVISEQISIETGIKVTTVFKMSYISSVLRSCNISNERFERLGPGTGRCGMQCPMSLLRQQVVCCKLTILLFL